MSDAVKTLYGTTERLIAERLAKMVDDSERTPSFEDHAKMSAALTAQTAIKEVLSNFSQHVQFIRFNAETSVSCKIFSCHYVCCYNLDESKANHLAVFFQAKEYLGRNRHAVNTFQMHGVCA